MSAAALKAEMGLQRRTSRRMRMKTLTAPLLATFLAVGASASAGLADQIPATISVVGHASVTRRPDVAIVTAEITSNDPNASHAAALNDEIQSRVADAIANLHLGADPVHTVSFRSVYVTPPSSADIHERSGYVVTRTIEVETQPTRIDETTRALTAAGVDAIDDVRTDVRDRDEIYHTLFIGSLKDAEAQAHIIATAARVKITRLRSVDASTLAPSSPGIAYAEARMSSIPIQNSTISATLSATYEVEPFPLPGYMRKMPYPPAGRGAH